MKIYAPDYKIFLRSIEVGDEDALLKTSNDYEIAANTPGMPHPYKREDAARFIDFAMRRQKEGLDFHMTVRRDDGEFVGMCAMANIDMQSRRAEVGYWIGRDYQGNDYARQAVSMIIEFGFEILALNRISSSVLATNDASIHILESLGFTNEGRARDEVFHMGKFHDVFKFAILKNGFKRKIGIVVKN
jgi:ribosomal-protein-alanine N-acetyltransferase